MAEQPINHGTEGGYRVHLRRGQQACEWCKHAVSQAKAARDARRADAVPGSRADQLLLQRRADARAAIVARNRRDAEAAS